MVSEWLDHRPCVLRQQFQRRRHVAGNHPRCHRLGMFQPLAALGRQAVVQQLFAMARQQRTVDADAQHHRAEAHRGAHARGHAGTLAGYAGHDVLLRVAVQQACTSTGNGNRQGEREIAATVDRPGAEQVAAAHQRQADRHHVGRGDAPRQSSTDARENQHSDGERQHTESRRDRGKTQAVL
ncbi:hypothetical protein D3C84_629690 [compost metagenome]